MKKLSRRLNPVLLKWAVVPLLTFLVAGLVTKKIVTARPAVAGPPFQQTVKASLKRLDSGDRAGAVAGLARAGNMAPNDSTAQLSLIPKFIALGEYRLAAEAIERSLRAAPRQRQTAGAYAGLCHFLLAHHDLANARRILTGDLTVRWPDAFQTALLQGEVALQGATGKDAIAAAAKQLQKCLALQPNDAPAQVQLGIADSRLGEWNKAESLLRAALEQRPIDPVALAHLGEVLRQQGKTAEAAKYLAECKRLNALQGRERQLEAQYALNTYQPKDLLELGRVYQQLGEFSRAASTLRVYNQLKPADTEGQRELAQACLKLNGRQSARVPTGLADSLSAARSPSASARAE